MLEAMKEWLSDGEWDIDSMIAHGWSEAYVIKVCLSLTDSPWYGYAL